MTSTRALVAFACAALLPASAALSDQPMTARAVVIDPAGGCGLFDGAMDAFFTEDTRVVGSHSANGNSKLTCKAEGVPNDTGAAVTWNYDNTSAYCVIATPHGALITDKWHSVVSASGVATLQCMYKLPDEP